jgi:20S proteasome alpha/beta subunit
MQAQHVMYQHSHNRPMSVSAAAQLLSNTLYYKRFFPYYTFNLCAGLDEQGNAHAMKAHGHASTGINIADVFSAMSCTLYHRGLLLALCYAGRGAVYNYDAIGSYERSGYFCQVCQGAQPCGNSMMQHVVCSFTPAVHQLSWLSLSTCLLLPFLPAGVWQGVDPASA